MQFIYGTETAIDSLGKPYVALLYGGVKAEGEAGPIGHDTPRSAWAAYFATLSTFLHEQGASLVEWRIPPTMEILEPLSEEEAVEWGVPPRKEKSYRVYSRLSVR